MAFEYKMGKYILDIVIIGSWHNNNNNVKENLKL